MKSKASRTKTRIQIGEPIVLDWNDATSGAHEWTKLADYNFAEHTASAGHRTAGFFIGQLNGFIFVSQNYREVDQMMGHVMSIPLSEVTDIRRLKRGKRK